jgi:hypothetical protein
VYVSTPIVNFQRRFQIWQYTTSHGQLLLRSPKSQDAPSRIDVAFKNVAGISLPTVFDGLEIFKSESDAEMPTILGVLSMQDRSIFRVQGVGFTGYIVAGTILWNEDSGEYYEPSPLLK